MAKRWNIFEIARRRSFGDEDQLTELLAYLIYTEPRVGTALLSDLGCETPSLTVATQRRVTDGRVDLELVATGNAEIVIESKLGAKTSYAQCAKYIEHLTKSTEPTRVLVLITKLEEGWPDGIVELAEKSGVQLATRRWWDITSVLEQTSSELASDFAEMLTEEGMIVPDPLTEGDWLSPGGIPYAARALLAELKPSLANLSAMPNHQAIYDGGDLYRSAYCSAKSKQAEIAIGLAASWDDLVKHRRVKPKTIRPPIDGSVISTFVRDLTVPMAARLTPAGEAVSASGPDVVGISWGQCPLRVAPAAAILTASDFQGQVEQAVEFVRETAGHFRRIGHLKDVPGFVETVPSDG